MTRNDRMHNLFQTGVILGRITQLSVDRGIVIADSGIWLADFLTILPDEIQKLPIAEPLKEKILEDVNNLLGNLSAYQKDSRLEPDDARIMISFVSRWTDVIYDELLNEEGNQNTPSNPDDETEKGMNPPEMNNGDTPKIVEKPQSDPAEPH